MTQAGWPVDLPNNAGANAHMIAVNEQLGFAIAGVSRDWELDLTSQPVTQS